jgi:hypothetical protein
MRESFGMMGTYQYVEMAEDEAPFCVVLYFKRGLPQAQVLHLFLLTGL